ncbi:MAG TPA: hypothetical protein VGC21_17740 [Telluria sp.]|jgi:hypothetical protein
MDTINDTMRINPQMQVALSVGMQADMAGRTCAKIDPDQILDDPQMAAAVKDVR